MLIAKLLTYFGFSKRPTVPSVRTVAPKSESTEIPHRDSVTRVVPINRKKDVAESSSSLPVVIPTLNEGSTRRSQAVLEVYTDIGELPSYQSVLTAEGGAVPVAKSSHETVAALLQNDKTSVLLLTVADGMSAQSLRSLEERLVAKSYDITKRAYATRELITEIYSIDLRRRERSDETESDATAESAESVRRFKEVIQEAITLDATDVHIEIREKTGQVLFRVNGVIEKSDRRHYDQQLLSEVVAVAFTKLADNNSRSHPSYNDRTPQDCVINFTSRDGRQYRIRYQRLPVSGGTSTILRILHNEASLGEDLTLESLGYEPSQEHALTLASRRANGLNLISGPTGSGKSTTLKVLMTSSPNLARIKSYSVEDPVEYRMRMVSQMSVQRTADNTADNPFVPAMRVILRSDPDVIMVGEIRDRPSGSMLSSMVQTGHRVFSTLHAQSAIECIGRLSSEAIGVSRDVMAARSFISSITHQALLRELCPFCRKAAVGVLPARRLSLIESKFGVDAKSINVVNEEGCNKCRKGVSGRTVAAEVFVPNADLRKLIRDGRDVEAEELWRRSRWADFTESDCTGKTAMEHAIYKMSQGRIDPFDIEDAFESFETYEVMPAEGVRPVMPEENMEPEG